MPAGPGDERAAAAEGCGQLLEPAVFQWPTAAAATGRGQQSMRQPGRSTRAAADRKGQQWQGRETRWHQVQAAADVLAGLTVAEPSRTPPDV
jgi:hypothetical protein